MYVEKKKNKSKQKYEKHFNCRAPFQLLPVGRAFDD